MADNKQRGRLEKVIVLVAVIAVLRANLPPDDVAHSLDMGRLGNAPGLKGFFSRLAARSMASEWVADWEYTDLGLVKIAHSDRLDLLAVGLPFCKWKVQDAED